MASATPAPAAVPPPLPGLDELLGLRGAARGLTLVARTRSRAALHGWHASAQRGRGMEFQEVRPYVAGDDPRSIDWRVTARRGRPHTKVFREERERPVWLLVDLSANLFFGSRRQLKSALAVRAAALLAWVAALGGDRVGALLSDGHTCRILPPRAREAGVLPLLEALVAMQPRAPAAPAGAAMEAALRSFAALARPGCLALLLSDFATLDETSEARYLALGAADCRLFWITDGLEEHALPSGRFRVGRPWARAVMLDGERVRERWRASWREREQRLARLARRLAAPLLRLDTRLPVREALQPL